ncbi:hypothetical protein [Providencia phage Kokobel2]|nr:hypothetical protein [Providencia phage Kokobel2]
MNREQAKRLLAAIAEMQKMVGEDCRLDHRGYCQEHWLHNVNECPVAVIKELVGPLEQIVERGNLIEVKKLEDLIGYYQNASDNVLHLSVDDATGEYIVSAYSYGLNPERIWCESGGTLEEAINNAYIEHGEDWTK